MGWVFFNFLTGNMDGHAKNLSLMYQGKQVRLAPLYDMMCTDIYEDLSKKLAMKIARSMQCKLELAQNDAQPGSIEAAVFFAQGVNALENGAPDKARTYFDQAIRLDPAYRAKVEQLP